MIRRKNKLEAGSQGVIVEGALALHLLLFVFRIFPFKFQSWHVSSCVLVMYLNLSATTTSFNYGLSRVYLGFCLSAFCTCFFNGTILDYQGLRQIGWLSSSQLDKQVYSSSK
jgi:hypothetical protein